MRKNNKLQESVQKQTNCNSTILQVIFQPLIRIGANYIAYRLYEGAAQVGDQNAPAGSGYGAGNVPQNGRAYTGAALTNYTISAEIDLAAAQPAGTYTDTVAVTLAF